MKQFATDIELRKCSYDFGLRLRQMRPLLGVSQVEYIRSAGGFRQGTISRLERGCSSCVSLDMLTAISRWAAEHRISLAWLFTGEGAPKAQQNADAVSPSIESRLAAIEAKLDQFQTHVPERKTS
jgi:hypothetical protein